MTLGRSQSGKIQVGCFIGIIVVAVVIWIAIKTIPVATKTAEFEKTVSHHAERINLPRHNEAVLKEAILEKANELEIPITERDIHVKKGKSTVQVRISYTIQIDYGFYVYDWSEDLDIDRPIF